MMKKLFKWDLFFYFDQLKWILAGSILFSLVTFIFKEVKASNIGIDFIYNTTFILSIVGILVSLFYAFFLVLRRFYLSVLKDEGYFTHTLPISKTHIILAKYLAGVVAVLIAAVLAILLFFLIGVLNWNDLMMMKDLDPSSFNMMVYGVLVALCSTLISLMIFYAALSYEFSFNQKEWLNVFVFFMIYYAINQLLSMINLGIAYLINPNIFSNDQTLVVDAVLPIIVINFIFTVGLGIAAFFVTKFYISKKLNLKNG
ncbi:hypothetical protein JV173_03990 [Acholeplasma equirhinis]|uniref:hypothetical protein n=1 Tax=Acholeplasma equirhinis TaxID=555393 RepID=UPI00197A8D98|nr:hypothetical protein [Acholeplasma equirhinis]MBN3490671.1 hypothetical protein [Acholeplasma equirhinis]